VSPVLSRAETQEWEWTRAWTVALTRFLLEDPDYAVANREVLSRWVSDWLPQALEAAVALAPLAAQVPSGIDVEQAVERVRAYAGAMLVEAGLPELGELIGVEAAVEADGAPAAAVSAPTRRVRTPRVRAVSGNGNGSGASHEPAVTAGAAPGAHGDAEGTYDYVGIVMAKSAEGDAVAAILAKRHDIEVTEQPAFWDIRAKDRLVIPYTDVSEQLGYEIDAYSIQHEMSTHYGRMVATDDALMLFSDPTEAMQYLMA
jgi:propane monooxygenase coupling protein